MKLPRLNLSTIIFNTLFTLSFGRKFTGNLIFPFSKFTMNNKDFNSLILNLSCKDVFSNIKECAEQCFYREKNGVWCVAFLKYKNTKECYICNPANVSERNSNSTQINKNGIDLVYILKYKKKTPVMYLPLEGDTIADTTVIGGGVNGTLMLKGNTQVQAGKVNEGLHVKRGARLVLDDTDDKCIGNLTVCTRGLSIAFWIKPSVLLYHGRHITHGDFSINIQAKPNGRISVWTYGLPNFFLGFTRQSTVSVGHWTHVTATFDPNVGMFVYMDGILDAFKSIDEAFPHSFPYGPVDYVFGSKTGGEYSFEGTLDEIKIFYDSLTSTGTFYQQLSSNFLF